MVTPNCCSATLGGRVTTIVLEDCYHVITLDQQRDVVLEATRDYGWMIEKQLADKTKTPVPKPQIVKGLSVNR